MANIGRMIAASGALVGGYAKGAKMYDDAEYEKEKQQRERDEYARQEDERRLASSTIGAVGNTSGAAASGEEALSAGMGSMEAAVAGAATPEAKAVAQKAYEPTIAALQAARGTAAQEGTTYTRDQADGDYLRGLYGINPAKAMQVEAAQHQLKKNRSEDAYQSGVKDWMQNSRYGKVMSANQQADQEYQNALAGYQEQIKSGASPETVGPQPVAPSRQKYGLADSLADSAGFLAYEAKHGKFDPTKWQGLAEKMDKIESEGYTKVLKLAEAGAPITKVAEEFGKYGEMKFDPKSVISDKTSKAIIRGVEVPTRIITYRDSKGSEQTINVSAELAGMGEAKDLLATHFAINADKRAGSADSRASESHRLALPAAKVASEIGTLRMSYANATSPEEKKKIGEKINALQATGGGDKDAPSEVKLANAFLRSGLAKTEAEALKMATTTKDISPEKMRFELTKSLSTQLGGDPERVKKQVDAFMTTLGSAQQGGGGNGKPAPAVGTKGMVNGVPATWDGNGWVAISQQQPETPAPAAQQASPEMSAIKGGIGWNQIRNPTAVAR